MKVIRYTLLGNGKVPSAMVDGGYFGKSNGGQSPQDFDYIGLSLGWTGLEKYTTKADFENYINSFLTNADIINNTENVTIQDYIDSLWDKSLVV